MVPPLKPWSRLPVHLLPSQSAAHIQARAYSSSSGDQQPEKNDAKQIDETTKSPPTTFGFQSLSGLFQQPLRSRYSRPREPFDQVAAEDAKASLEQGASASGVGATFFQSSTEAPPRSLQSVEGSDVSEQVATPTGRESETKVFTAANSDIPTTSSETIVSETQKPSSRRIRRHFTAGNSNHAFYKLGRLEEAKRRRAARVPNPYARSNTDGNPQARRVQSTAKTPARPWGLSGHKAEQHNQNAESQASATLPSADHDVAESASPLSIKTYGSTPPQPARALTHVRSSGEAHMVDVGDKAATKRVAIAFGTVRFSNTEPFRLIIENNNKKGDVLGVARIAGIMAAKRTSDLIPLCHPIALTKVELDIKLEPSGIKNSWIRSSNFGVVTIQALVECTGPTGVEMEALTAVSGAALTIYDMCKAVDKRMSLGTAFMVYKSGGRSGLFLNEAWYDHYGKGMVASRCLEAPDPEKLLAERKRRFSEKARTREGDDEAIE